MRQSCESCGWGGGGVGGWKKGKRTRTVGKGAVDDAKLVAHHELEAAQGRVPQGLGGALAFRRVRVYPPRVGKEEREEEEEEEEGVGRGCCHFLDGMWMRLSRDSLSLSLLLHATAAAKWGKQGR